MGQISLRRGNRTAYGWFCHSGPSGVVVASPCRRDREPCAGEVRCAEGPISARLAVTRLLLAGYEPGLVRLWSGYLAR